MIIFDEDRVEEALRVGMFLSVPSAEEAEDNINMCHMASGSRDFGSNHTWPTLCLYLLYLRLPEYLPAVIRRPLQVRQYIMCSS